MEKHDYIIKIKGSEKAKQGLCSFTRMLGGFAIADEMMPFVYCLGIEDRNKPRIIQFLRDQARDYNLAEPCMNEFPHYASTSPASRVLQLQVKGFGLLPASELHPAAKIEPKMVKSASRQNIEGPKYPFKSNSSKIEHR